MVILVLGLGLFSFTFGQSYPPSNLQGASLRSWLKSDWYDGEHSQLGYTNARRKMYNYIDNENNKIEDVYSGYLRNWNYGGTGTNPQPINCEHTIPQSFFGSSEPMRSDIHQLFPVHSSTNSSRGNHPFGEIDDNLTSRWWLNGSSQTSIPTSGIDNYSEYYTGVFEPRESHKGNVARAVFYFYTMYPTQAGPISMVGDIEVLYQWHLQDPVDSKEAERNDEIEQYQGNRNPFVDHPELVSRAWEVGTSGSSQLFISEYVEGSSYNKAIEIVNLTGSTVNLSSYKLKKQTNGSGSWTSGYTLSGNLNNGEVYVVANTSAWSSLSSKADALTGNAAMTFNGNDPIGLFYNNTLIDIVGNFNGGSSYFASNVTLRRKISVTDPSTTYNTSEWTSYSSNTFGDVGAYGSAKALWVGNTTSGADEAGAADWSQGLNVFPNPFQDRLQIELPGEWNTGLAADLENEDAIDHNPTQERLFTVELLDMVGRVLQTQVVSPGMVVDLNVAGLSTGVYLVRVGDGTVFQTHKVVKR